jgi:hypothetical protein
VTARLDLLRLRFRRHQLHLRPGSKRRAGTVDLLDIGVQDTGPDGAAWALANRGAPAAAGDDLVYAWTLRGAPHAYRRADVADVVVATAPWSEADAAKRIFDASKPLKAAGIPVLDALRHVAEVMRELVTEPTVKGDLSGALTEALEPPYLRWCRPCGATHAYEQPFRLAALQAGLELEPGTSPPILRRIPGFRPAPYDRSAAEAPARFDVVRGHLLYFPGAGPAHVAGFVDAPRKEVEARWPEDAVEVSTGSWVLRADVDELGSGTGADRAVRLLGSHDPYLQLRDRQLLVPDASKHKAIWPTIGRPGGVVADGELLATWRPKTAKGALTVRLAPLGRLTKADRAAVAVEAERLAASRGVALAGVVDEPG